MKAITVIASFCIVFAASRLAAQEPHNMPAPQKEHEWLAQFVGEWEMESEATAAPGQPAMHSTGTISSRAVGGFWVVSDLKADMMGTQFVALQTFGYDTESNKYVGTWVDSMANYMWRYEGTVDPSGKALILDTEGPNYMLDGKLTKFRDAYEFKSKDHIVMTSSMMGDDGKWATFMTGHARRKK